MVLSYVTFTPVSADFLNVLVCFLTSVVIIPVLCFLLPLVGVRLALLFLKGFCIMEAYDPEWKAWSWLWWWSLQLLSLVLWVSLLSLSSPFVLWFELLYKKKKRIFESVGFKRWPLLSIPAHWSVSHAEQREQKSKKNQEVPSGSWERKPLKYLHGQ